MTDPREEGYLGINELRFRGKPNYDDMEEVDDKEIQEDESTSNI